MFARCGAGQCFPVHSKGYLLVLTLSVLTFTVYWP